jgi:thiamine-monophosphate kinase
MGEFELLARLRERLGEPGRRVRIGIGDDAAVIVPGGATATSVDAVVDGVHFRRATAPLQSIGRKALAAGLSDLAAMGAEPGEAYIVLGVPDDLDEEGCLAVLDGIEALAAETHTQLAGGDVTRAPALAIAVTAVGHAPDPHRFVTRAGAAEGQPVAVTGELGGAAAGLRLLDEPALGERLDPAVADALRARQLEPRPLLAEGMALAETGARAMIDISDGLGADAGHLAAESGLRIEIDVDSIPLQAGVSELAKAAGENPLELAAGGGEDYELLVCLPAEAVEASGQALAALGCSLTVIGSCQAGSGVSLSGSGGRAIPSRGYDHLA